MNPLPNNLLNEHLQNGDSESIDELDPELILAQTLADPDLVQHIVRSRRDGLETIACYYRCEFMAGQQRFVLHIPFSPPLNRVPAIEAYVSDLEDVRIRITDRQKFGARLEIVLPKPAEQSIKLLVEAMVSPDPSS